MEGALAGVAPEEVGDGGAGLTDGGERFGVVGVGQGLVGENPRHRPAGAGFLELEVVEEALCELAVAAGGGVADGGTVLSEPALEATAAAAELSVGCADASGVEGGREGQEHGPELEGLGESFLALGLEPGGDLGGGREAGGGHFLGHFTHFGALDASLDEGFGNEEGSGDGDDTGEDDLFGEGTEKITAARVLVAEEWFAPGGAVELVAVVVAAGEIGCVAHGGPPKGIMAGGGMVEQEENEKINQICRKTAAIHL